MAFLAVRKARVLAEAEESTTRYREGSSLSVLDGVPVAVKDEADLAGCSKSLGSSRDFTGPSGNTSWCVRKWEEAGAIVIGKLNMHEIGLGTVKLSYICSYCTWCILDLNLPRCWSLWEVFDLFYTHAYP